MNGVKSAFVPVDVTTDTVADTPVSVSKVNWKALGLQLIYPVVVGVSEFFLLPHVGAMKAKLPSMASRQEA